MNIKKCQLSENQQITCPKPLSYRALEFEFRLFSSIVWEQFGSLQTGCIVLMRCENRKRSFLFTNKILSSCCSCILTVRFFSRRIVLLFTSWTKAGVKFQIFCLVGSFGIVGADMDTNLIPAWLSIRMPASHCESHPHWHLLRNQAMMALSVGLHARHTLPMRENNPLVVGDIGRFPVNSSFL